MARRPRKRPGGTRTRLLEAAVQHFAEHGYDGASIRLIQRDAAADAAAVHYHFGSKDALFREVVQTFLSPILAERQRLFDEIPAGLDRASRLEALVRAYIGPHMKRAASEPLGPSYARLIARTLVEPITDTLFAAAVDEVRLRFITAIQACLPTSSPDEIARCLGFAVSIMVVSPNDPVFRALRNTDAVEAGASTLIDFATRFILGGFQSALPECGKTTKK